LNIAELTQDRARVTTERVRGHSRSLKMISFNIHPMVSY